MANKVKKKERRISLFLGYAGKKNHFVDETIYDFYNNISNKSNLIKQILYEYAINNSGGNIVTTTITSNVTTSEQLKVTDNVTLNEQQSKVTDNVKDNVTEKDTDTVTGNGEIDFDEFISEEEIEVDEENGNNGFDVMACMDSMNQFIKK